MTNQEEIQNAIEWIEGLRDGWNDNDNVKYCNMAIKALEQEPCEDCISRSYVISELIKHQHSPEFCIEHHIDNSIDLGMATIVVNSAPSVTPARKKGKWEYVQYDVNPKIGNWHCSNCRLIVNLGFEGAPYYHYCPSCGSYNGGVKE